MFIAQTAERMSVAPEERKILSAQGVPLLRSGEVIGSFGSINIWSLRDQNQRLGE
jgi:hypothetical protein